MDNSAELESIYLLMDLGELEKALKSLQSLTKDYPEDPEVVSMLGECYLSLGEPQKAIRPLRWASHQRVKLRKHAAAYFFDLWIDHYLLGTAYSCCFQFKKAMKHLDMANHLRPNNSEIIRHLGWVSCMTGKIIQGRAMLLRAISLNPLNALAYNDLGASYLCEERFPEAKQWIQKAMEMSPGDDCILAVAERLEEILSYKKMLRK